MVVPAAGVELVGPVLGALTGVIGGLLGGGRSAAQVCADTKKILQDFITGARNDLPWSRESSVRTSYTRDVFRSKAQANCGNIFPSYDKLIAARIATTGPLPDDVDPNNRSIPPEIRASKQPPASRVIEGAKSISPLIIGTVIAVVIGGMLLGGLRIIRR